MPSTTEIQPDARLFFKLVEGEKRLSLPGPDGAIAATIAPARGAARGLFILVHGAASNASRWEEFVEKTSLSEDWDILRFDLRGHGASTTRAPATLERHADDIARLMDLVGRSRAVILGHSLGAAAAMEFARTRPERVEGLVLLDPLLSNCLTSKAAAMRRKRWMPALLEKIGAAARALGCERTLPPYSLRTGDERAREMIARGGEALEAFVKEYSSPWRDLHHIHLADYGRDLLEVGRPTPDLRGVEAPILIIGASSGSYTDPEAMRREAARLRTGEFVLLPCRHWPVTECLGDLMRTIEDWARRHFSVR